MSSVTNIERLQLNKWLPSLQVPLGPLESLEPLERLDPLEPLDPRFLIPEYRNFSHFVRPFASLDIN